MTVIADAPEQEQPEQEADPYPWLLQPTGICLCGHEREAHAGRKHGGRCLDPGCQWDRPEPRCERYRRDGEDLLAERARAAANEPLRDAMHRQDARRRRSGQTRRARKAGRWGVGPSDVGNCRAAIGYREDPPEDFEPLEEDKRAAIIGSWLDKEYKRLVRQQYPWRRVNVKVRVPGFDEESEADVYDPIIRMLEDLKTKGEYGWDRIGEDGAYPADIDQAMLYAFALIRSGQPVETIRLRYLRRAKGEDEVFDYPYDEARALAALSRLHGVIDALDMGLPLPRDREGPTLSGLCRGCFARAHCWNMDAAEVAGRTPEGWTLARDDAGIEAALEAYDAAHEQLARPGGKAKEQAMALVLGAPPGTYGEMIYKPAVSKTTWQPDQEARAEQLAAAMADARQRGVPPPDPESLPMPEAPVVASGRTSIKRVRVAARGKAKETT